MPLTLEERMKAYLATYTQEVRDLAETFCSATTRLEGAASRPPADLSEDIRRAAKARGVPAETLRAAVIDFSGIEAEAETLHRARQRP